MAAALTIQVGPRPARLRPVLRLTSSAAGRLSRRARAHPPAGPWAGSISTAVTDEEVLTYASDPSDRLVGVARDAEPVAATTDAGTTNYLWDEQNLLAELDEALDTLAQYTDYPGVWGGLSSVHAGGASAFFAPDLSSNIRLLLNAAQGVEQASRYGAFGVPLAVATASPFGFGGGLGYFDDGLDRLYVRARHYRPGLGAWMSRDPLGGLLGGYGYVGNSPVGWVDPSGWQRSPGLPPDSRYPESLPYVPSAPAWPFDEEQGQKARDWGTKVLNLAVDALNRHFRRRLQEAIGEAKRFLESGPLRRQFRRLKDATAEEIEELLRNPKLRRFGLVPETNRLRPRVGGPRRWLRRLGPLDTALDAFDIIVGARATIWCWAYSCCSFWACSIPLLAAVLSFGVSTAAVLLAETVVGFILLEAVAWLISYGSDLYREWHAQCFPRGLLIG